MLNSPKRVESVEYTVVYHGDGEFSTWPFNGGMWKTNNGVVVAFISHDHNYSVPENLHDTKVVRYGSVISPIEDKQDRLSHARIKTYGTIHAIQTIDGGNMWADGGVISDDVKTSEQMLHNETPDVELRGFSNQGALMVR